MATTDTQQQTSMKAPEPRKSTSGYKGSWASGPTKGRPRGQADKTERHGQGERAFLGELWVVADGGRDAGRMDTEDDDDAGLRPAEGAAGWNRVGSMMPNLWVYEAPIRRYPYSRLRGPGVRWIGKSANYKDIIELKSDSDASTRHASER